MRIQIIYLSPASLCQQLVAAPGQLLTQQSTIKENKELAPMLGIAASLFLLMMFNVPIPGGTIAHAVGGVLLSILPTGYAASLL